MFPIKIKPLELPAHGQAEAKKVCLAQRDAMRLVLAKYLDHLSGR